MTHEEKCNQLKIIGAEMDGKENAFVEEYEVLVDKEGSRFFVMNGFRKGLYEATSMGFVFVYETIDHGPIETSLLPWEVHTEGCVEYTMPTKVRRVINEKLHGILCGGLHPRSCCRSSCEVVRVLEMSGAFICEVRRMKADDCKSNGVQLPTCLLCAAKHVGRAKILRGETFLGYPDHYFDALAEMSMAETELVDLYPELARVMREQRLQLQGDAAYVVGWHELYDAILEKMIWHGTVPENLVLTDAPKVCKDT